MNSSEFFPEQTSTHSSAASLAGLEEAEELRRAGVTPAARGVGVGLQAVSQVEEADPQPASSGLITRTVVLADDHPVVRQSLKRLLYQQADLRLVGESNDGLETLGLVRQLRPDLLVTDLMMPGMNGLEVTRRVRLSMPSTRIVVVSVNGDAPYVAGALRCGANAFVLKTACSRHLLPAIRAVLAGGRYISPPLDDPSWG